VENSSSGDRLKLRQFIETCPQPVAVALGHLHRARSPQERLDASLRAGEVLARYTAAAALASFAGRQGAGTDGLSLPELKGPLSFGHFLSLVQQICAFDINHPLAPYLASFRAKKKGRTVEPGTADAALVSILNLRNDLGHDLIAISEPRAKSLLAEKNPESRLLEALRSLEGLLSCPLFVVEDQRLDRGQILARRLWLMGESRDPEPEELRLAQPIHFNGYPYVAVSEVVLSLWPGLIWNIMPERQSYGLLFIDHISTATLRYKSMDPVVREVNGENLAALKNITSGKSMPPEYLETQDKRHFAWLWREEKVRKLEALKRTEGRIPWRDFDEATLEWYAKRLPVEEEEADPQRGIIKLLFDGRERLREEEIFQTTLLFGSEAAVRRMLQRDSMDLRVVSEKRKRWDERITGSTNILKSLRTAVDFFARHVQIEHASLDDLKEISGTADYLAMREALVNLFIHQDYHDTSAPAQVELRSEQALFFNTGYSLVSREGLIEGGKSQARNPLIARALRLIGFAELAGSGLRVLQEAWRGAKRKPPQFESNREANTFTVSLDWRIVPDTYDSLWKDKIGARLTHEQAQLMNLCGDPIGITLEQAASGTGLGLAEANTALKYLVRQALIEQREARYFVKEYLKELINP
jgi:predicted HTH transcriptional regulator